MKTISIFCFIFCLISLSNCSSDSEISREVLVINNYSRTPQSKITLGIILTGQNIFKGRLEVSIKHDKSTSEWSNLVFMVVLDDSLYYAVSKDYRFQEKKITDETDSPTKFYIELSELNYTSPFPREVSAKEIMSGFKTAQKIHIAATMNDPSLLKNPLSSSSLLHSAPVEIEFK
jgi:hypothetical protein